MIKISPMNKITALTLALAPAILTAADSSVYLETTPGSGLTIDGPLDSIPTVRSAPIRRAENQKWRRSPDGAWSSVQNPAYCLAFQDAVDASPLTVRPCTDLLVYRDSKRESTRGLQVLPTPNVLVDTGSKDAVLAFYNAQFFPPNPPPEIGFTGDVAVCTPGTTSAAFRAAVTQRMNFMRNLAGLGDVVQDDGLSAQAQTSALIMAATGRIDHNPDNTWKCFTDGGLVASQKSNLFQGVLGWDAVAGYVDEGGVLGHRRWVLFPGLQRFGTGDVPRTPANVQSFNALFVITGDTPPANPQIRDGFTAWPPKGFVPYKLAYKTWSFSVPQADLTGANVTLTDAAGAAIPANNASGLQNGYGDNTYSFEPAFANGTRPAPGGPDIAVTVTINNVIVGGTPRNYTYVVTLIDIVDPPTDLIADFNGIGFQTPLQAGSVFCNLKVVDGTRNNAGVYAFTLVPGAGSDDNGLFNVNAATLVNSADVDLIAKKAFNIRVRADNGRPGGVIEKAITIPSPFAN